MAIKKRIAVLTLVIALTASLFSACSGTGPREGQTAADMAGEQAQPYQATDGKTGTDQKSTETRTGTSDGASTENDEAALAEFDKLATEYTKEPGKLFEFISTNISGLSKGTASKLVLKLEEVQKTYLGELEKSFYSGEMEAKLAEIFIKDFSLMNNPEKIADAEAKELISNTLENGYRIDTAEGMFFPVIDYNRYKDFVQHTEDDITGYIGIMAQHFGKLPAKDAALVIDWDEIAERALAQESFILSYPQSERISEVKSLFENYRIYTFLGLNNTPLFDYQTKEMDDQAIEAYKEVLSAESSGDGSGYLGQLGSFMSLLEKSGYKLTQEADVYRKELLNFNI